MLLVTLCYFNMIFPDLSYRTIATIFPTCCNFKIPFGADTEKETQSFPRKGNGLQSACQHGPLQNKAVSRFCQHAGAFDCTDLTF